MHDSVKHPALLVVLLVMLGACSNAPTQDPAIHTATTVKPASCEGLATLSLPDTSIQSADIVSNTQSFTDQDLNLPEFCRVVGTIKTAVGFEVWLPMSNWNGKYQGVGNGGMAGRIRYDSLAAALQRGYATAATDTGHKAGPIPFDASWGAGRSDLIEDFGHRGLHVTTVAAKAITQQFYGQAPRYSYYVGCSKGGQQGLMEVQRYPEDFDGVVAGNPANDWTRFYAGSHLWYSLAMLEDPESYLPPTKLPLLGNAVNAACDGLDGIQDGILQDPRRCQFDANTLVCPTGQDHNNCLTSKQVIAIQKIWSGVADQDGNLIYPGLVPGGEASPGGWGLWVTGEEPFRSLHWLGGEGFFRHFVFEDPDWDFRSFDYDRDLPYALAKVGGAVDAADTDLRPFRDAGGKLLIYHGWSDADISPLGSIEYLEKVATRLAPNRGLSAAVAEVSDFYRLFMVPGMGHCRGGPGTDQFDALAALEDWVEEALAPTRLVARKIEDGAVVMTRPLCAYPRQAVWKGTGDTNNEKSFECREVNAK